VNKFGQIFPILGVENTMIWGNFHPFDFTSKSHLRRIILCQGYSTFFQTYFRITLYYVITIGRKNEVLCAEAGSLAAECFTIMYGGRQKKLAII
jgi:hypothetical protein